MSYVLEGIKWGSTDFGTPSGEITWSVDWTNLDVGTYSLEQFETSLQTAFDTWENVAAIDFVYSADFDTADVALTFEDIDGLGSTVGLAGYFYGDYSGGPLKPTSDMFIRFDQAEPWDPSAGPGLDFTTVALHEIGHVLGLAHTEDSGQIMYAFVSYGIDREDLGQGDIYAAQLLYGLDEGDVAVEDPGADAVAYSGGGSGGGFGAVIIGILLAIVSLFSGTGFGGPAAATIRPDEDADDDAADDHAYDLADILPVTGLLGDEPWDGDTEEGAEVEGLHVIM